MSEKHSVHTSSSQELSEELSEEFSQELSQELSEELSEEFSEESSQELSQELSQEDSSSTIEFISTEITDTDQVIVTSSTKEVPILVESITERLLLSPLPPNHPSTIANNSVSVISYSDSYPEGTVHHKKGATDELINPSNQSFHNFFSYNPALYDDSIQLLNSSKNSSSSMSHLQNLNFDVIYVTGWDDNYHPRQLLPNDNNTDVNGTKHGKGWQSKRRCTYPQEIILRVTDGTARVRKLQILSHHYKIASKLEIYIGSIQQKVSSNTSDSDDSIDEKRTFSWDKLPKIIDTDGINSVDGEIEDDYVTDDYDLIKSNSNERANYKARELKSVKLDAEGQFIRLVAR
ncbi:13789_t:CDS:2, partial [Racocetra fulgida]